MRKREVWTHSLIAAAVAVGMSPAALAQDDGVRTEEVQRAVEELERAEDRFESAEETVEQREEELEAAIASAAESERSDSSDRAVSGESQWDDSDWEALTDEHRDLGTFVEALRVTGLGDTLTDGTAYTVFAPVNDAFEDDREDLLSDENRDELIELLRAHIIADDVDLERARTLDEALTVDGDTVDVAVEDDELMIGDARVVGADFRRGNLRVYPIDEVLEGRSRVALGDADED